MHHTKKYLLPLALSLALTNNAVANTNHYESALQAFNLSEMDSAQIHIKNALQENPQNLSAKLLFAQILIELKSFSAAEQELTSAIEQGADINLIIKPLGESLLFQGKFEQVLAIGKNKNLHPNGTIELALVKALAYRGQNKVDEALYEYQQLLNRYPTNVEALLGLARIEVFKNNTSTANALVDKALASNPNHGLAWQLKAQLIKNESPSLALEYLEKANRLTPKNLTIIRNIANINIALGQFSLADDYVEQALNLAPTDPHSLLMKGTILKNQNNANVANKVLVELSTNLSNVSEEYLLSQPELNLIDGMSSYAQQSWNHARDKFLHYINNEQDPNAINVNAIILLADVYIKLDELSTAVSLLEKYEHLLLKDKDFSIILAGLYLQYKQTFKASYVIDKLRRVYPQDTNVLIMYSAILKKEQKQVEALALLESNNVKQDVNFQHTLAVLAFDIGDYEKSLDYINNAINIAPTAPIYQLFQAQVLNITGDVERAESIIETLYKHYPKNRLVQANYALNQYQKGDLKTADDIFTSLTKQLPEDGDSWITLADIKYRSGNVEDAVSILEKVKELPQFRRQAYVNLATLYFNEKRYQQSIEISNILINNNRVDDEAIAMKANALIQLHDVEETNRLLRILSGLWQGMPEKLYHLSSLQQRIKNYAAAEKSLAQALELAPNALPVLIDSIKLNIRLRKFTLANDNIARAEKLVGKNDIRLMILKGDLAKVNKELTAAFKHYANVLSTDDNNAIALIKLSQISHDPALSSKFITLLEALVEKYPNRAFDRNTLADHLMTHQLYARAKYHYQVLLTQNIPLANRGFALNNLGVIAIVDENYQQAVQLAQQAIDLIKPNKVAAIFDTLGWALSLSGEYTQGLNYLRQAFSMESHKGDVQYHIAYTLVKLDRITEAKMALNNILQMPDNFPEYALAKTLSAELNK